MQNTQHVCVCIACLLLRTDLSMPSLANEHILWPCLLCLLCVQYTASLACSNVCTLTAQTHCLDDWCIYSSVYRDHGSVRYMERCRQQVSFRAHCNGTHASQWCCMACVGRHILLLRATGRCTKNDSRNTRAPLTHWFPLLVPLLHITAACIIPSQSNTCSSVPV